MFGLWRCKGRSHHLQGSNQVRYFAIGFMLVPSVLAVVAMLIKLGPDISKGVNMLYVMAGMATAFIGGMLLLAVKLKDLK